jgi:hypothetical protein
MTTNKQLRNLLESFASELTSSRSNLDNDDQRWGYDQAISVFLHTTGKADFAWVWEINHPFSGTVASLTGVTRTRHVEINNFKEKSGYLNPPSYRLMKNTKEI